MPYKNKHALEKKGLSLSYEMLFVSDVSGPYYTFFTLHYSSKAILFFSPFSVVWPTQKIKIVTA